MFRLTRDDANFVQVIHTNAGLLGETAPVGHVDFCVNGGTMQPSCSREPQLISKLKQFSTNNILKHPLSKCSSTIIKDSLRIYLKQVKQHLLKILFNLRQCLYEGFHKDFMICDLLLIDKQSLQLLSLSRRSITQHTKICIILENKWQCHLIFRNGPQKIWIKRGRTVHRNMVGVQYKWYTRR